MFVKLDRQQPYFSGEVQDGPMGKKMSVSLEQLDSYSFLEDPRYSCANLSRNAFCGVSCIIEKFSSKLYEGG